MRIQLPERNYIVSVYLKHSWKDKVTVTWTSTGSDPKEHVMIVTFDEFVLNYLKRAKSIPQHSRAEDHFVIKSIFHKR